MSPIRSMRFAALWLVLGLGCGGEQPPVTTPPGQPRHLVVISLDTVRADAVGAWGATTGATPRIDGLASQGVRFEQHMAAAPTTLASHTSLMTGRYPHHHGVPRNAHRVHQDNVMLAERLTAKGFRTAAFLGAMPLASHSGFLQGFEHVDARFDRQREAGRFEQTERAGDQVTDAVLAWLDSTKPASERLFVFAHYFDAHQPYLPSASHRAQVGSQRTQASLEDVRAVARKMVSGTATDGERAELRGLYAAEVASVDREVGRLIDGMRARGLEDALVVIWGDHGEGWSHPVERFDHGYGVFRETVHTPLLWLEPGLSARVVPQPVSAVDLAPTLQARFGLAPEPSDGVDLAPALRGGDVPLRPVFSEATKPFEPADGWINGPRLKTVQLGNLKLVWNPIGDRVWLYDVVRDPNERQNLAQDPARRSDVQRLRVLLQKWSASADPLPSEKVETGAVLDQLRDLGYLD